MKIQSRASASVRRQIETSGGDPLASLVQEISLLGLSSKLTELSRIVRKSNLKIQHVEDYVKFMTNNYHREPVIRTDEFDVLVLSWLPGQVSPIHNHRGSACCVKVLQGTAIETVYMPDSNGRFTTRSWVRVEGAVLAGEDADVHVVANRSDAGIGLVTLHVYRPALTQMELFETIGSRLVRQRRPASDSNSEKVVSAG